MSNIIDDADSSVIYSSGWRSGGSPQEYDQTTTSANEPGMTARLNFQGVKISVFGTIGPDKGYGFPESSYVVDGSDPVYFSPSETNMPQYRQQFYESPTLSDGSHTLIVTNIYRSDRLYLDYFVVTLADPKSTTSPPPPPPQITTSSSSQTQASTSSSRSPSASSGTTITTSNSRITITGSSTNGPSVIGNITATASFTVTVSSPGYPVDGTLSGTANAIASTSANSASGSGMSSHTAIVIASALGAVLVVILLLLCLIFACRRRKKSPGDEQIISSFPVVREPSESVGREKAAPPYAAESLQFTFQDASTMYSLDVTNATQPLSPSASSLATAGLQSTPLLPHRPPRLRYFTTQPDSPDTSSPLYPSNDPPSYDQEVMHSPSSPGQSLPAKLRNEFNFGNRGPAGQKEDT